MLPKVFIVILNWNGQKDTLACLNSLKNLDYSNFKIILIDNASTDNSVGVFKSQIPNFKNKITLIENKDNLGFPAGNNVGIKYALKNNAEYVLLLNNDTVVDKDFLKEIVAAGEKNVLIGILGPKIYFFDDPKRIWFAGGKFNWISGSSHIGFGEIDKGQFEISKEVNFITGCAMLIKKEVFEKIGFLDGRFFLYYEDTDFCLRAKKRGFKCLFAPRAKIFHKIPLENLKIKLSGAANRIGVPPVHYYHHRNVLMLIQNNAPLPIKFLKHFWVLWKLIKQGIKIIFFPEKRAGSYAIAKGFFDYYRGHFGQIRNPKSEIQNKSQRV